METCAHCDNFLSTPKFSCRKCKAKTYCSRKCRVAHWKTHQMDCPASTTTVPESYYVTTYTPPQPRPASSEGNGGRIYRIPLSQPYTAIQNGTFLRELQHDKDLVFAVLIDILRLRQADRFHFDGKEMRGSIYAYDNNGEKNETSMEAFRSFLTRASHIEGFLPTWWSDEVREECVQFGLRGGQFSLARMSEGVHMQILWGDASMGMKLRALGEMIWGYGVGKGSGKVWLWFRAVDEEVEAMRS